ncbi:LuxR C-terminal-related transcriptional regulator [Symbioplanes lichenis]|uniref:LuxR C-terminal-related transcriptional regulator n=1 Tax=Symbioplanes lichenis TaxID=1629072 RepID=UPI002739E9F3|nr:response regulator transcription factor [Actinoplanes lichenis]
MDSRKSAVTVRDGGRRIVTVADNELSRRGLHEMLQSLDSVAGVDSVMPAPHVTLPESRFDVLVVACDDLTAGGPRRLAEAAAGRGAKVLVLFSHRTGDLLDPVTRFPGDGFLITNDLTETTLEEALGRIAGGEIPMPAALTNHLLRGVTEGPRGARADDPGLTSRERETLRLMVQGLSNKQIARQLLISQHGVKRLVANVLVKLNCANRTLAAAVAIKQGLVGEGV